MAAAATAASAAAATVPLAAFCEHYFLGYTPCFVEGFTKEICCADLGEMVLPLDKDDERWMTPSVNFSASRAALCFDGGVHTAVECCTSGWSRVIPGLPPMASQASLEEAHLGSSTLTKYDFFGTEVLSVAYKQDSMDWLYDELVLQDQYRLRELRLRAHAVILDVGCASGLVSIVLAKWFPLARIFCMEPNPTRLMYLRWNLRLNGVEDRVTVIPAGLGNRAEGIIRASYRFRVPGTCRANLPPHLEVLAGDGGDTQLDRDTSSRTFAEVQAQYGIGRRGEPLDLLKVDCEGCEYIAELPPSRELAGQVHDPAFYFPGGKLQFHILAYSGYRSSVHGSWVWRKRRVDAVHGRFCRNSTGAGRHVEGCDGVARWLGRRARFPPPAPEKTAVSPLPGPRSSPRASPPAPPTPPRD